MNSIGNLYNRIFKQAYKDAEGVNKMYGFDVKCIATVDMSQFCEK